MKQFNKYIFLACIVMLSVPAALHAKEKVQGNSKSNLGPIYNAVGSPVATLMNINNISMWARHDGFMERNPFDNSSGVTFPRGTATVIYASGLVWGGYVNDGDPQRLRVGGVTYNVGLQGGRILPDKTAEPQSNSDIRIYRIRRDWATADLRLDAAEINTVALNQVTDGQVAAVRSQYKKDWLEWPAFKGAPFYERNGINGYQPSPDGLVDTTNSFDEPGFAGGDQVVWFVANDLDGGKTNGLYGSKPIGIEEQVTLWAYARTDALGNVIFKRFRFIYKGHQNTPANATIDSMYVSQWADPDLGDYGDDFAGCDTNLSLGFIYNSTSSDADYANFGLTPPASGYDFFAGPAVPGLPTDTAIIDLKKVGGKKNLPMTSFIYFAAGGLYSDPTLGQYEGTLQWYNMLIGRPPTPTGPPPPPVLTNPVTGQPTSYWLSGDPVTNTGWVDGIIEPAGDRRLCLTSGPFSMALGDTQEIVVAMLAGISSDRIGAIQVLKFYDRSAQQAYNTLFNVPKGPATPDVKYTELNKEILMEFETNTASVNAIENYSEAGYKFEGYNIYQLSSITPDFKSAKRLATYDLENDILVIKDLGVNSDGDVLEQIVARGSDNGIQRTFRVTYDAFVNRPLVNGRQYYFAVTAYSVNLNGVPRVIESPMQVQVVIPQAPNPGTQYAYSFGDTSILVKNHTGDNDADVRIEIFNPAMANGKNYYTSFSVGASKTWSLIEENAGGNDTLIADDPILFGDATLHHMKNLGFNIRVFDAPISGLRNVGLADTNGNIVSANIFGRTDPTGTFRLYTDGDDIQAFTTDVTKLDTLIQLRFGDSSIARARKLTDTTKYYWQTVPFSCYLVWKDTLGVTNSRKLFVLYFDKNGDSIWNTNGNDAIDNFSVFDNIGLTKTAYKTSPLPSAVQTIGWFKPAGQKIQNVLLADVHGDETQPPAGTTIQFTPKRMLHNGDVKKFTIKKVIKGDVSLAKEAVKNINVFPNPYYGMNVDELDRYSRFVTFSHLPEKATIRLFDLAGTLVRVLEKNDPDQYLRWDLTNYNNLPVASGIYLAHIEMKDIGETKILKLMIVQEQQYLQRY